MPIPLLLFAGLGTAAVGAISGFAAADRIDEAKRRYERRRRQYDRANEEYLGAWRTTQARVESLGKTRLAAMITLGRAAEFLRAADVRERSFDGELSCSDHCLHKWEAASLKAGELIGGISGSALSGAATAAAAYGLVGLFGTASTGTAISSLGGVCASNATMAWFGCGSLAVGGGGIALGTVVVGSLVVGPAVLVGSFFAHAKASEVETQVEARIADMAVAEWQMETQIAAWSVLNQRADELQRAGQELDAALSRLLANASPSDAHDAFLVANAATTLAQSLDAPLVSSN